MWTRHGHHINGTEKEVLVETEVSDPVNHPSHYTSYIGVEIIQITEKFNFNLGNAIKYISRAPFKGNEIQDLEKALWYMNRELNRDPGVYLKHLGTNLIDDINLLTAQMNYLTGSAIQKILWGAIEPPVKSHLEKAIEFVEERIRISKEFR